MKSYYPVYDYPVNQTGPEENWKIKKVYFVNQGMVHYDAIHFWEIIIIINTSYYYHFPKFNESVWKFEVYVRAPIIGNGSFKIFNNFPILTREADAV